MRAQFLTMALRDWKERRRRWRDDQILIFTWNSWGFDRIGALRRSENLFLVIWATNQVSLFVIIFNFRHCWHCTLYFDVLKCSTSKNKDHRIVDDDVFILVLIEWHQILWLWLSGSGWVDWLSVNAKGKCIPRQVLFQSQSSTGNDWIISDRCHYLNLSQKLVSWSMAK